MSSKFAKQYQARDSKERRVGAQVPPEFPDILKDFTREVLRSQPDNINEFAAKCPYSLYIEDHTRVGALERQVFQALIVLQPCLNLNRYFECLASGLPADAGAPAPQELDMWLSHW